MRSGDQSGFHSQFLNVSSRYTGLIVRTKIAVSYFTLKQYVLFCTIARSVKIQRQKVEGRTGLLLLSRTDLKEPGVVQLKEMSARTTRSHTRSCGIDQPSEAADSKKRKAEKLCVLSDIHQSKSKSHKSMSVAKKVIMEYNTDPYDYQDEILIDGVILMFQHFDLYRKFFIEVETIQIFASKVRSFYNPENLFHNFKHAWGVLHIAFHILINGGDQYLLPLDIFAVMVAALCHDIQHPGNNNAFEAATSSDLSKVKEGIVGAGILECHHATLTNNLLNAIGSDCDILSGLTDEQCDHFRRQVGLIILGTDMAKHTSLLTEARAYASCNSTARSPKSNNSQKSDISNAIHHKNGIHKHPAGNTERTILKTNINHSQIAYEDAKPKNVGGVDITDPESRISFTRVLVHTADLGAQTQSTEIALKWMERCYGEFRSQAQREEILGIVTSPFLHDLKEDNKTFSAQYSFIEETVEPLWTALSTFLPSLAFANDQLVSNKLGYKRMLDDYLSAHQKGL